MRRIKVVLRLKLDALLSHEQIAGAEALAERNPTDMDAADMPLNMTASLGAVRRGFIRIADPDVTDAGIDAPKQRHGGRLDQGGFLGWPSGWNR